MENIQSQVAPVEQSEHQNIRTSEHQSAAKGHLRELVLEAHINEVPLGSFYDIKEHMSEAASLASACPVSARELFEMCEGEEALEKTYLDLVKQSIRYIETILELEDEISNPDKYDKEMVQMRDRARGSAHTVFIDTTNRMSRLLYKYGKENSFFGSVIQSMGNGQYHRAPYTLFAMQFAMSYYSLEHPEILTK